MPLMLVMFIDLLEIPSFLTLAFQKENVSSMRAITKTNELQVFFETFTVKM